MEQKRRRRSCVYFLFCLFAFLADVGEAASGVLQIRRAVHPVKTASTSIVDSRELGSEMKVSEEQSRKAPSPIVVSESGSVMDVSEEHSPKARAPILVSESGSVIDVSEEQ